MTGILRGFDPYMNIVMDDAVEERSNDEKINIGMVVGSVYVTSTWGKGPFRAVFFSSKWSYCYCGVEYALSYKMRY